MFNRLFSGPRLQYLLAHLPHMLLGVALVLVFSRLVAAEEFGQYAKGFAYINIAGALLYGWLQISLLRLAEGIERNAGPKLGTVFLAIVLPVAPCFFLATILGWFDLIAYPVAAASAAVAYGSSVCLSQYARGINNAGLYGLLGITRLLVVLGVAYVLTRHVPSAASLLYAMVAGGAAATFMGAIFIAYTGSKKLQSTEAVPLHEAGFVSLSDLFRYGVPASISLVAVMLLIHGDRFIVGLLLGDVETAYYSAQADLARQMIYPIIAALSVSLVPIALQKNREYTGNVARIFVDRESTTTLNLILPILIMLIVFGNEIMSIMLPTDYVNTAEPIAALIAISAFLTGCRLVRFDPQLHLTLQASKIGLSALIGLMIWIGFVLPLTYFFGLIGTACAGILGAVSSLLYAYRAAVSKELSISILAKSTVILLLLLFGVAIVIRQFIFGSDGATVLSLCIVLFFLYALSLLFYRWTIIHEQN